MRILIWAGSYPPDPGGVGVVTRELARSLAAQGDLVQVVTQSGDEHGVSDTEPEGMVHRLPFHQVLSSRNPERVIAMAERVAAIARAFQPDVVHVHAIHPSEFFLRTPPLAARPLIFTLHGWTPLSRGADTLRERLLRQAAWVTGCSRHVVDRAVREVPEIEGRSAAIVNGCDDPGVPAAPLPFDPPSVLCVGRLVHSKGFDAVIRALPVLARTHPGIRLAIAGDGAERDALVRACARHGVSKRTEFLGEITRAQVFARLNAATLLVVPSRGGSEGLPMVALEAGLMARPVVAARDGGLPEAVVDGRTGFLVESDDQDALTTSMLRVLDDPAVATALGRAGRRHVLENFRWDAHVAAYSTLYRTVTGA